MPSKETTGQRFKRLREAAGLTQQQVVEATGIPLGTIRNWEQGRRSPLLETAAKVARVIGCAVDDLAPEEEKPAPKRRRKE